MKIKYKQTNVNNFYLTSLLMVCNLKLSLEPELCNIKVFKIQEKLFKIPDFKFNLLSIK